MLKNNGNTVDEYTRRYRNAYKDHIGMHRVQAA